VDAIRSIRDDDRMTIVDERAVVPNLDDEMLGRLARVFDREGVVAASLIGSRGRGGGGALSDIDIGVWHEPGLGPSERSQLRLALLTGASKAIGTEEVDLVPLNDASPLIRHRAVRDGRRLIERDARRRVQLEAQAILDYLDTKPLRAELAQGLRNRIEEGRFGRP
jgi:predicted nucleotidyltransferase